MLLFIASIRHGLKKIQAILSGAAAKKNCTDRHLSINDPGIIIAWPVIKNVFGFDNIVTIRQEWRIVYAVRDFYRNLRMKGFYKKELA
jgi:hypothetical protein